MRPFLLRQIPTRTIRAKAKRTTLILPAAPLAFFERITTKNQTQPLIAEYLWLRWFSALQKGYAYRMVYVEKIW